MMDEAQFARQQILSRGQVGAHLAPPDAPPVDWKTITLEDLRLREDLRAFLRQLPTELEMAITVEIARRSLGEAFVPTLEVLLRGTSRPLRRSADTPAPAAPDQRSERGSSRTEAASSAPRRIPEWL
jgi:hypothetical protein